MLGLAACFMGSLVRTLTSQEHGGRRPAPPQAMTQVVPVPQTAEDDEIHRPRIPPPVLGLTASKGPEGITILEEVPGELGVLLWRAFRRTATSSWAQAHGAGGSPLEPPAPRTPLDIGSVSMPAGLRDALTALYAGVRPGEQEGQAAAVIGRWAATEGYRRLSAEYLQLSACAQPFDPVLALDAAWATAALGDRSRAAVWFQRAAGLAGRLNEWRIYVSAHLGYGRMLREAGHLHAARSWTERALHRATRQGMRSYEERAREELTRLAI
jgi:hypothetical protein